MKPRSRFGGLAAALGTALLLFIFSPVPPSATAQGLTSAEKRELDLLLRPMLRRLTGAERDWLRSGCKALYAWDDLAYYEPEFYDQTLKDAMAAALTGWIEYEYVESIIEYMCEHIGTRKPKYKRPLTRLEALSIIDESMRYVCKEGYVEISNNILRGMFQAVGDFPDKALVEVFFKALVEGKTERVINIAQAMEIDLLDAKALVEDFKKSMERNNALCRYLYRPGSI